MPKGSKASLFLSSTCYDLGQLRADLRDFAESIGFDPILSEFDTFPVNPNQDTLSNCLEAVRSKSDIFVLVVGGRYGSITETGQSITNLEFAEANAKGIPKYVFIKRDIWSLLSLWRDNPDGDFRSAVDTPKLFEFISTLTDSGEIWIHPFENAQDIVKTLKRQLSYLFSESLDIRRKFYGAGAIHTFSSPTALRLSIEKPDGWEWLLFARTLADRIDSYHSKRLDTELGITFEEPVPLNEFEDFLSWIRTRMRWISAIIPQLTNSLDVGFLAAVGGPGEPGDIDRINHLATRMADGYEKLLDWKLQFLRLSVEKRFRRAVTLASQFASNSISEIEEFSENLYPRIEQIISKLEKEDEGGEIVLTLKLTAPDPSELIAELERLHAEES